MYVLLKRAKKNVGDFLIGQRAQALVEAVKPDHELKVLDAWKPLDPHLDLLNEAAAVIICGGPGIQSRSYPSVYPLVTPLERLTTPIAMLGSGWQGTPGDEQTVRDFQFTSDSMRLLRRVDGAHLLAVRDYISERVLRRAGLSNITMTGCPAWHHLPSRGKAMHVPTELKEVVFTPPRNRLYANQCRQLMSGLRRWLPDATLYCCFHRGVTVDQYSSAAEAQDNQIMLGFAREYDYQIRDTSYDLDKISFYDRCDLHVGYRVHGHLDFLSRRRPSLLLSEDSRGRGACEALGLRAFPAWRRRPMVDYLQYVPTRVGHSLRRRFGPFEADPTIADQALAYLQQEADSGFRRYAGIPTILDRTYEQSMHPFLSQLPD